MLNFCSDKTHLSLRKFHSLARRLTALPVSHEIVSLSLFPLCTYKKKETGAVTRPSYTFSLSSSGVDAIYQSGAQFTQPAVCGKIRKRLFLVNENWLSATHKVVTEMEKKIMEPVCRAPCLFEFAYSTVVACASRTQKMDHVPPAPGETAIPLMDCWCDSFFLGGSVSDLRAQRMRNRFLVHEALHGTKQLWVNLVDQGIFSLGNNFTLAFYCPLVKIFFSVCGKNREDHFLVQRSHENSHHRHFLDRRAKLSLSGRVHVPKRYFIALSALCTFSVAPANCSKRISFILYAAIILPRPLASQTKAFYLQCLSPDGTLSLWWPLQIFADFIFQTHARDRRKCRYT